MMMRICHHRGQVIIWIRIILRRLLTLRNGHLVRDDFPHALSDIRTHSGVASTVNNDVVLHFILFIPSLDHRPMKVIKADGK